MGRPPQFIEKRLAALRACGVRPARILEWFLYPQDALLVVRAVPALADDGHVDSLLVELMKGVTFGIRTTVTECVVSMMRPSWSVMT
jgi:hypothetical protein